MKGIVLDATKIWKKKNKLWGGGLKIKRHLEKTEENNDYEKMRQNDVNGCYTGLGSFCWNLNHHHTL